MSTEDMPESHNYTKAVATRLTPQQKERLEAYKEENQLGTTPALRRLIRAGLDEAEQDDGDDDNTGPGPTTLLGRIARDSVFLSALVVALFSLSLPFGGVLLLQSGDVLFGTAILVGSVVALFASMSVFIISLLAKLALARPLGGIVGLSAPDNE